MAHHAAERGQRPTALPVPGRAVQDAAPERRARSCPGLPGRYWIVKMCVLLIDSMFCGAPNRMVTKAV
jgi:hypothetical protein